MTESACPIPKPDSEAGWEALKALIGQRSLLAALEAMHTHVGDAFRITMPAFQPAVFVGPESSRPILVTDRAKFDWRNENDPVTELLHHGLLVEDGESHQCLRDLMNPLLQRREVQRHIGEMSRYTDLILDEWQDGQTVDMLVEMRRAALLILMGSLFGVDFYEDMDRMWRPILRSIDYISPGIWLLWDKAPRFGYRKPLKELDEYLYQLIRTRREEVAVGGATSNRLKHLNQHVKNPGD
jgi:cytochrome P450